LSGKLLHLEVVPNVHMRKWKYDRGYAFSLAMALCIGLLQDKIVTQSCPEIIKSEKGSSLVNSYIPLMGFKSY